jgi:hypothetical protein
VQTPLELAEVGVGEISEPGELPLRELGQAALTTDEIAESIDTSMLASGRSVACNLVAG